MSAARLLLAVSGLILWSSGLVALYAVVSLGCESGIHRQAFLGTNALTALLLAVLLVHLAALAALQWSALSRWRRERAETSSRAFLALVTCLVTAVGLAGVLVVGLPVVMVPPCS